MLTSPLTPVHMEEDVEEKKSRKERRMRGKYWETGAWDLGIDILVMWESGKAINLSKFSAIMKNKILYVIIEFLQAGGWNVKYERVLVHWLWELTLVMRLILRYYMPKTQHNNQ